MNMPPVARRGEIGDLLQQVLDEEHLSDRGFAKRLADRYGGTIDSHRSQVGRILKGQVPIRRTAIQYAEALGKPPDFFLPEPEPVVVDAALLSRLVQLLEAEPERASTDLAPLLQELSDQLGELAFRLRRATEQTNEGSQHA